MRRIPSVAFVLLFQRRAKEGDQSACILASIFVCVLTPLWLLPFLLLLQKNNNFLWENNYFDFGRSLHFLSFRSWGLRRASLEGNVTCLTWLSLHFLVNSSALGSGHLMPRLYQWFQRCVCLCIILNKALCVSALIKAS